MADDNCLLPALPRRRRDAHKGDFGHVLVVAGSPGMTGAGCLAARAAQRAGAGLVTLALPRSLNLAAEIAASSVMSMPLPETEDGVLGLEAASQVLAQAERFDVLAIGPGLGRSQQTRRMVRRLVTNAAVPVVVDADGLNALAEDLQPLRRRRAPTILTPHPGEMSRLAALEGTAQVQEDRVGVAQGFAREHGCIVALKGAGTVVTDGERVRINETGNPGMATGGTGDVLTGLVAGLLCQGLDPFDAARLGAFAHGLAGDLAAQTTGELSLVAEDMLACVPKVFMALAAQAGEDGTADPQQIIGAVLGRD